MITPEQVGTQVLKFLLRVTAEYLGHDQVNKAVIAVPAKFDANQRKATGEAYRQAGLKVMRVIEEPTAAAVAYKLHKKSNIHHILVYDFGGGTLDVSLLYVAKGSVQVYATDGDETLGGSDFDLCLAKTLKAKVEAVSGRGIANQHNNRPDAPSSASASSASAVSEDELCLFPSIHTKAEEIKKGLTSSDSMEFSCVLPVSPPPPSFSSRFSWSLATLPGLPRDRPLPRAPRGRLRARLCPSFRPRPAAGGAPAGVAR